MNQLFELKKQFCLLSHNSKATGSSNLKIILGCTEMLYLWTASAYVYSLLSLFQAEESLKQGEAARLLQIFDQN